MNSTSLIEASKTDYEMLKGKGKYGEEVLHYLGFLDGFALGYKTAEEDKSNDN